MRKIDPKGETLRVRTQGDLRVIELGKEKWRLRVLLEGNAVKLIDDESGEMLYEQPAEDVGFTLVSGEWEPAGEARKATLTAFAISWIVLQPKH